MIDSIGVRLRQAREFRNLTLQQVSETTKIRSHYLQALESDDHSAIPSAAQARGFLRIYAEFLDLDLADLVPSAQPIEPPSARQVTSAGEGSASESPRPNLWTSLRERLAPRKSKEDGVANAMPATPEAAPQASPSSQPSDQAQVTPVEGAPAASVVEIKTKASRRTKTAPRDTAADSNNPNDKKKSTIS